jgi:hypothetical protein
MLKEQGAITSRVTANESNYLRYWKYCVYHIDVLSCEK